MQVARGVNIEPETCSAFKTLDPLIFMLFFFLRRGGRLSPCENLALCHSHRSHSSSSSSSSSRFTYTLHMLGSSDAAPTAEQPKGRKRRQPLHQGRRLVTCSPRTAA